MRFSRDRRGQSVVIGTVILFGFLILALSLYQVQVVPQENSDIEFDHSQQVEGEFLDLRNAVLSASRTGAGRSTSLKLGTRYPQRTFALNPPPASGQLSTTDPRELRIENATVEGDENVVAYWNNRTEMDDAIAFDTRSLRYSPGYNEFRNGPDLVYEHSLVVAEFENTVLSRTGQTAVDGDNRIRLTALDGSVDESGVERTSLDPETLSQSRRSVTLNSTGNDPIVLELPTDVSTERAGDLESEWRDRLGEDDATIEDVTVAGGTVRVELTGSSTYRLELGKVGLGAGATATNESNGYITKVSTENQAAVAEVRDQFNNPVAGAAVQVNVSGNVSSRLTDDDGQVSVTPEGSPRVDMSINDGAENWETTVFQAGTVGSGNNGDSINPSGETDVTLTDVGLDGNDVAQLQFRNQADEDRTFQSMEFTLYYRPQGNTRENFNITDPGDGTQRLELRSGFQELETPINIPAGATKTVTLEFDKTVNGDLLGVSFEDDLNRRSLYLAGLEGEIDQPDGGGDGSTSTSDIAMRVDDVTRRNTDNPEFYVSYDTDVTFDNIEVSATSTTSTASDSISSTAGRNGVFLSPTFGQGQEFEITVEALNGGEVVANRTILTTADTQNPTENDDLSQGGSAVLDSSTIQDRTQTNRDNVRYRFTYDVSENGPFSEVQLYALNRNNDGASASEARTGRSENNVDVEPGFGANTEYKLAILVVDADGAVIDARIIDDPADGTDPV
ncbi:Ig-like domain-containing protein [Halorubrum lipolyticum]|uniref:Uncharacterized protein n=1 Tax=Halorubrum lipolyticum DSM 21995 TaxID=1227482 RepID=M0NM53_9EURY|nr:Ig-like domain-containing protein [Halorubrum lipolyticum]EMA58663.1 hypothetical protein C469_12605 [Halorubrum lipolyticum DSM 21995]